MFFFGILGLLININDFKVVSTFEVFFANFAMFSIALIDLGVMPVTYNRKTYFSVLFDSALTFSNSSVDSVFLAFS